MNDSPLSSPKVDLSGTQKPHLIVVAESIHPTAGSEAGKGWWWSSALGKHFQLHIVCAEYFVAKVSSHEEAIRQQWRLYPVKDAVTTWKYGIGYLQYAVWLRRAMKVIRGIMAEVPVAGLCHVVMGSFRILGKYDQLGIPYVVGPLGGGEYAPSAFLKGREVPLWHKALETLRPYINLASALVPSLRRCMNSARLVMVTSEEGEKVVRAMGAQRVEVVFPDAYNFDINVEEVSALREQQAGTVKDSIRLLWQGRALWWKAPDLALQVLERALACGLKVNLTMVSQWETGVGKAVQAQARRMGLANHVSFLQFMPRAEFLKIAREHHAFLATSLHDSGGIPLIEAQANGLPCLTLALGGNRQAACPDAGVSLGVTSPEDFVEKSVARLIRWQNAPDTWVRESKTALRFSMQFSEARLENFVKETIVPILVPGSGVDA